MELKLDESEVKEILLVWAMRNMPQSALNEVRMDCSYGTCRGAILTHTDVPFVEVE